MIRSNLALLAASATFALTAVTPYGAVISILTQPEKDKLDIAIGEYNPSVHSFPC